MSFTCKACGRHRAGASGEVCTECRTTQMGMAACLLLHFENRRPGDEYITALETILDDASNPPPEGRADGSVTDRQWDALRALVVAARAFNAALDNVQLATIERRP